MLTAASYRNRLVLILVLLLLPAAVATAGPAVPDEEDARVAAGEEEAPVESEVPELPAAGDGAAEEGADAKKPGIWKRYFSDWRYLDWLHDWTEDSSRGTARWFDGFFAGDQLEQQADVSFGRMNALFRYDEREGLEPDFGFRARFVLPNLDNKFNVMIGRMDEDEFVSDSYESFEELPESFTQGEDGDNSWLLGFGYNPVNRKRSNLHFSVGVRVDWPPDPYVKGRYYYKFITGSRSQVRLQETVWWRLEDGVGSLSQATFEYMPGQRHLIRWANGLEISELSEGWIWQSRVTLYQNISDKRAMAYQIGARGETDMPDPIEYYGFRVVYRQNFHRDWLFWEARTGVYWPRSETLDVPAPYEDTPHEAVPFIALGLEIFFGKGPMISKPID